MRLVVFVGSMVQVRDWLISLPYRHRSPFPVVFRRLRGRRPLAGTSVPGHPRWPKAAGTHDASMCYAATYSRCTKERGIFARRKIGAVGTRRRTVKLRRLTLVFGLVLGLMTFVA